MKRNLLSALLAIGMILSMMPAASAASDGGVKLKDTNEVRHIDRVELPDFAIALYETLEEAADGDGYHDYLIDDEYFDLSGENISSNNPGDFIRGNVTSSSTGITTRYTAILVTSVETASADETTNAHILDCIGTVAAAFHRDHPEVFWLSGYSCICYIRNGRMHYCFVLSSSSDAGVSDRRIAEFRPGGGLDIQEVMAKRDADVEKIISTIPAGADRFTQIYYLNKWLTENNSYNTIVRSGLNNGVPTKEIDRPWDSTRCVSALAGQKGAAGPECGGYANAFKVLCDALGIPCVHVRYDHGATSHSWNYVQMEDGKWYAVDVDFNDRNDDSANLAKYLLVGGKTVIDGKAFLTNHPAENPVYTNGIAFPNGPELSDTAYPRSVHLAYNGMPETLSAGDSVSMTPVLLYGSGTSYTYSNANLPAGLTLDPKTGKITGKVTDASKAVSVTVMATSSKDTAKCTLEFPKTASTADPGADTTFTDVPDWCSAAVGWAVSEGITNGTGNSKFSPNDMCKNTEILTFLWRAAGKPESATASPFTVASYYQDAVDWAYGKGLIDRSFVPDASCTRASALKFIWQALGSQSGESNSFTDVPAGASYADAVAWGVANGITNGYGAEFRPGNTCSRAEIVTFLHRAYVPSARLKA